MECINISFDVLETDSTKKIMIGDTSRNWLNAKDLPAYLYVTLPGSKKPKVMEFTKNSIKVLYYSDLENIDSDKGKDIDLPDGLYKIRLQSGFEEHFCEKYYLKTDKIERGIRKAIINNALNISTSNEIFIKKVFDVDWKLRVAKSFASESDVPNTMRYYNEALDIFKCIK